MDKLKNGLYTILLLVVITVVGAVVKSVTRDVLDPDKETLIAQAAEQAAAQFNASGPKKMDEVTTLTHMEADGVRLIYNYTIDGAVIDYPTTAADDIKAMVINSACTNEKMVRSLRDGALFEYRYRDSYNTEISRFLIAKATCSIP